MQLQNEEKKYYITTPIFYVNDVPHIGHSYTAIAADVLRRYMLFSGRQGYLLTGTDEHGQKIQKAAEELGITPKELADRVVVRFIELWRKLGVQYDDFIRTTEPRHEKVVKHFFSTMLEKGDVYKGMYEGWYCVPCETFWTESQLVDDKFCPDCGRPVERVQEESYFFKLSKYQQPLLEYYEQNPEFVEPEGKYNEVKSMVRQGLKDISITRKTVKWGINVPTGEDFTIYVWFDALINYVSAAGFLAQDDKFAELWPADVHIIGKDILKFHAVIWPAMLMSMGLPLPRKVFAHGWWTVEGEKMSKSRGNVIDPNKEAEVYGIDAYRYFLLREVPFGGDGDYSRDAIKLRVNTELANDLGNLFSRVIGMAEKYVDSVIEPAQYEEPSFSAIKAQIEASFDEIDQLYLHLRFNVILERIWDIISLLNKYTVEMEPWALAKKDDAESRKKLVAVLYNLVEGLRNIALLVYPFMPNKAQEMWEMLGYSEKIDAATSAFLGFGKIEKPHRLGTRRILFKRIE